jgi:hypothetical protein
LAFVRAEIDSRRFGARYAILIPQVGTTRRSLIDEADLLDERANLDRMRLLATVRGYRLNKFLFQQFPNDVRWRYVTMPVRDLDRVKYANCEPWATYSGGGRLVVDGARNFESMPADDRANVSAVANAVRDGKVYPPLITVDGPNDSLVLVEGHTRATAFAIVNGPAIIPVFVGSSTSMPRWVFY